MNQSQIPNLTEREKQIWALVSHGLPNKEIARSLNVSSRTVEFHLNNIFKKLGVSSRTSVALLAEKNGLLEK